MAAVDVSVCIATCGRPAGLERLLEALGRLELPRDLAFEVLVVDNDAAGSAAPVLARFAARLPLQALSEPRRNIAHARNRALDAARGEWLAFIDDDEVPQPGWLAALWVEARSGAADAWFGPVVPVLERNVTRWLVPSLYAARRHATGASVGVFDAKTGNALVRAALFAGRRFDPSLGLRGGSDTEIFGQMLGAGARFAWCDEAVVHELVPAARHRLRWLSRRAFRGGFVHTLIEMRRGGRAVGLRVAPRALAGLLALLLAAPLAVLSGRTGAVHLWLRGCTQAGHLWALLGRDHAEYEAA